MGTTAYAFANGDGGLLVVDVDDAGTVVGVVENPETCWSDWRASGGRAAASRLQRSAAGTTSTDAPVPDDDLERVVRLAPESRRRVKQQHER